MNRRSQAAVGAITGIVGGVVALGLVVMLRACSVAAGFTQFEERIARHFAALVRRDAR